MYNIRPTYVLIFTWVTYRWETRFSNSRRMNLKPLTNPTLFGCKVTRYAKVTTMIVILSWWNYTVEDFIISAQDDFLQCFRTQSVSILRKPSEYTTPMFVNLFCFAGFFFAHGLLDHKSDTTDMQRRGSCTSCWLQFLQR